MYINAGSAYKEPIVPQHTIRLENHFLQCTLILRGLIKYGTECGIYINDYSPQALSVFIVLVSSYLSRVGYMLEKANKDKVRGKTFFRTKAQAPVYRGTDCAESWKRYGQRGQPEEAVPQPSSLLLSFMSKLLEYASCSFATR